MFMVGGTWGHLPSNMMANARGMLTNTKIQRIRTVVPRSGVGNAGRNGATLSFMKATSYLGETKYRSEAMLWIHVTK